MRHHRPVVALIGLAALFLATAPLAPPRVMHTYASNMMLTFIATPDASPVVLPAASPVAEPGTPARFLPPTEELGEGWSLVTTGAPEADPAFFVDTASALYVGPSGGRVLILIYRNAPGRAALQRSWEDVGAVFESYRFEVTGYATDREEELAAQPLPEGCVDARRVNGVDPVFGLPGAVTQCAIDPDILTLVIVSGPWNGLADHQASDAITSLVYRAGTST